MAFDTTKLQTFVATTPGIFHYVAPAGDDQAAIVAADYFLTAQPRLVAGDLIIITDPVNGTATMAVVTLSDATNLDVVLLDSKTQP